MTTKIQVLEIFPKTCEKGNMNIFNIDKAYPTNNLIG